MPSIALYNMNREKVGEVTLDERSLPLRLKNR
jgi:hypothetical protein